MALSVIIIFYAGIGLLAAAGSIFISQKVFSGRGQQIFLLYFSLRSRDFIWRSPPISETKERGDWKRER